MLRLFKMLRLHRLVLLILRLVLVIARVRLGGRRSPSGCFCRLPSARINRATPHVSPTRGWRGISTAREARFGAGGAASWVGHRLLC